MPAKILLYKSLFHKMKPAIKSKWKNLKVDILCVFQISSDAFLVTLEVCWLFPRISSNQANLRVLNVFQWSSGVKLGAKTMIGCLSGSRWRWTDKTATNNSKLYQCQSQIFFRNWSWTMKKTNQENHCCKMYFLKE